MYSYNDFDSQGYLKAPVLFWAILLFQARTWLLLAIDILALWWLVMNRRLRDYFSLHHE